MTTRAILVLLTNNSNHLELLAGQQQTVLHRAQQLGDEQQPHRTHQVTVMRASTASEIVGVTDERLLCD